MSYNSNDEEILKLLINENHLIWPEQHSLYNKKWFVRLFEKQCKTSRVQINNIPSDCIIIDVESFFSSHKMFRGINNENKKSDFIMVCPSQKLCIIIEQKNGKANNSDVYFQLLGSKCIWGYIREVGVQFCNKKDFLQKYEIKLVSFYNTNINKKSTSRQRTISTEKFKRLNGQVFQFNEIISSK